MIILFEILAIVAIVAFCLVVWWPAALLALGVGFGYMAWNLNRNRGDRS